MAYCFMKIDKIKSLGTLKVAYEHNFRKGLDENVDKSRSYLNEELIKMPEGQTYVDGFKRKMLEIGHIPRKNAVLALDIQLTYNQKDVGPDFDFEKCTEYIHMRNPKAKIFPVSAKTGEGIAAVAQWLKEEVTNWKR